eukprot:CAMPEP_0116844550 /NCGR_PEP_ID=MMETSP0418-20121206/12759_1 /TAXON_ID=1158023 /ORGANISM="Astrosyne radiata, Strain 13vi08-1A" /LENGTH=225 /DNA_ID=CAMNT_0004475533 /DNA_START=135 /DNA_END=812 /DNA_ORIENTATION=-
MTEEATNNGEVSAAENEVPVESTKNLRESFSQITQTTTGSLSSIDADDDEGPKKVVRFGSITTEETNLSLDDEDIREFWYSRFDFFHMKQHDFAVRCRHAEVEETTSFETLGTCVVESIDAVLEEQERQRMEGIDDPDAIADKYAKQCAPVTEHANRMGRLDQEAALNGRELQEEKAAPPRPSVPSRVGAQVLRHVRKNLKRAGKIKKGIQFSVSSIRWNKEISS